MLNERWALWRVVKWLRQIFSGAESVEAISFDTGFDNPTHSEGLFFYDNTEDSLAYYNEEAELTVHVGQDSVVKVRNATGSLISKGEAVYSNGATGNRPNIVLARANALSTSRVLGLAAHDIENNTDGYVIQVGHIGDIDTSSFSAGDELFLSSATAGAITNTKPTGANFAVVVGECVVSNPSTGEIVVHLRPTADAAQKSIAQTVSGAWTFSNTLVISDTATLTLSGSATDFQIDADQNIWLQPASGHSVYVYRSGDNIDLRIYASTGTDYGEFVHDGNEFFINTDTAGDDLVFTTGGTANPRVRFQGSSHARFYYPISIPDGSTAPSTVSGQAFIYVDSADGDLKVKFGDGQVKVITNDTGISTYNESNVTTDRTYDADATSTAELADVLGTLIKDLRTQGIVG